MQEIKISHASDLNWQSLGESTAKFVVLAGDITQENYFVVRLKLPAHHRIEPHHHINFEYDTVIAGKCFIAMGDIFDQSKGIANVAGSFVLIPPFLPHYGWTETEGAIIQISGKGPWCPIYQNSHSHS